MNSKECSKAVTYLDALLEIVRAGLAESNDGDKLLQINEVAIECLQKDFRKRLANAIELEQRSAAA